jgi:hypothetical protein
VTAEHVGTRVAPLRMGTTAPVSLVPPLFLRLRLLLAPPGGEKAGCEPTGFALPRVPIAFMGRKQTHRLVRER